MKNKHLNVPMLVAVGATMLVNLNASAHGYMENPMARQAICKSQAGYWWPEDGSGIPNLACRDAFLENGHVVFTQSIEFSSNVADYNNLEAVQTIVTDGLLCAAGGAVKSGADLPSPHWQKTTVTPDAAGNITVEFWASTPHNPSFWEFYLTAPEFDAATDVLTWDDLSLIQTHGNLDMVTKNNGRRYYIMDVAIPDGRTGDAILYTRWQRNDEAGEGFYNCSDIIITSDSNPEEWFSVAYFWQQTDQANPGDNVRVRLFDNNGMELVDETLVVGADNQQNWQAELAGMLNQNYPALVQIGVADNAGNIAFDAINLVSNLVFTTNHLYTFDMTVTPGNTNSKPMLEPMADVSIDEESSVSVTAIATDADGDTLQYAWSVPSPLTFVATNEQVEITAPQIDADLSLTASVTVSDGRDSVSQSFTININNSALQHYPAWQPDKVYWLDDKVSYQGKNYRAKWWTLGELPDSAQVWELL